MEDRLPRLVEADDIRGILHCHTDRSDGVNSLDEMAEATRARGYAYFGVADHSKSDGYAGGLSVEEIEAQHAEIDRLNRRWRGKFRIFRASSPPSFRMDRSTIPTTCSPASISWSRACTAASG
jgi:DNA polymerase (family 10)